MHEEKGHPPAASAQAPSDPIESMMAAGEKPTQRGARDLAEEARAAARAALQPDPEAAPAPPRPQTEPGAIRREWLLRGLLVLNLALIGGVVALPIGKAPVEPAASPASGHGAAPATGHAAEAPRRSLGFAVGEQGLYLRALEMAGQGKFDDAIATLEGHLRANPYMGEVEQRLVYHALAMFAVRAGRNEEASRYEAAMDRLRIGAQLPQDLLDLARQAEAEGRGADMRRYYARFLLQQRQVPPSLRDKIAEAYLKLGDGYRIEAEHGAERQAASKRAAEAQGVPPAGDDGKAPAPDGNPGGHK
ncbi:MAG: hypothetical protein R3F56_23905 [Planctomycetota bacterium]